MMRPDPLEPPFATWGVLAPLGIPVGTLAYLLLRRPIGEGPALLVGLACVGLMVAFLVYEFAAWPLFCLWHRWHRRRAADRAADRRRRPGPSDLTAPNDFTESNDLTEPDDLTDS